MTSPPQACASKLMPAMQVVDLFCGGSMRTALEKEGDISAWEAAHLSHGSCPRIMMMTVEVVNKVLALQESVKMSSITEDVALRIHSLTTFKFSPSCGVIAVTSTTQTLTPLPARLYNY